MAQMMRFYSGLSVHDFDQLTWQRKNTLMAYMDETIKNMSK